MGIKNFTLLLQASGFLPERSIKQAFDTVLIDLQSILHLKLSDTFYTDFKDIVQDIQKQVFCWLIQFLQDLLEKHPLDALEIIISLDGEGVPLKWPEQRKRRSILTCIDCNPNSNNTRDFLRAVLFEHNDISHKVYNYLESQLSQSNFCQQFRQLPQYLTFVISGSHVPGEGEHKLFQLAHLRQRKRLLVVSVDNDVFIIAFLRRNQFDSIQIAKNNQTVYDISQLYITPAWLYSHYLFGNDFIPQLVQLTNSNVYTICEIIKSINSSLPETLHEILRQLDERKKIKFVRLNDYNDILLVEFWMNCLWIQDYYTRAEFDQKHMKNRFYDLFDRNRIITALLNRDYAIKTYNSAKHTYQYLKTYPYTKTKTKHEVFSEEQLKFLDSYLCEPVKDDDATVFEITWSLKKTKKNDLNKQI